MTEHTLKKNKRLRKGEKAPRCANMPDSELCRILHMAAIAGSRAYLQAKL